MTWLAGHWVYLVVALGMMLDIAANVMPEGRARSIVMALAHLSPMQVVSSAKQLRAAMGPQP